MAASYHIEFYRTANRPSAIRSADPENHNLERTKHGVDRMHRFRDIAAGIPDPTFSRTTTGSTGNGYTRGSGRVVKTVYPQTHSSAPDPARETRISTPDPWLDLMGLTSKHGVLRYGREGQDTGEKGRTNMEAVRQGAPACHYGETWRYPWGQTVFLCLCLDV